jgi:putative FmdB family regulatory protein
MPIYEYESRDPGKGCEKCRTRFEVLLLPNDAPIQECPACGKPLRKVISWCRAAVVETSEDATRVEQKIKEYEKEGMWSHAAELADTHSEKTRDKALKTRALEDYKRAGYDARTLDKHAGKD